MKRILSYMGAALILAGLLQPIANIPEAPVVHAEIQVDNAQEEKLKADKLKAEKLAQAKKIAKAKALKAKRLAEAKRQAYLKEQARLRALKPRTVKVSGTCSDWLKKAGIPETYAVKELIRRESGCNPNAVNPSSGACGIGQQLPCGKWEHQWNDPVGGLIDMNGYVKARYGTWESALAHHNRMGWY